jgi:hypothetical protein
MKGGKSGAITAMRLGDEAKSAQQNTGDHIPCLCVDSVIVIRIKWYIQEYHNINSQTLIKDAVYGLTFLAEPSLDRVVVCTGTTQAGVGAGVKVAVGSKSAPAVMITVTIWYAIDEPLNV